MLILNNAVVTVSLRKFIMHLLQTSAEISAESCEPQLKNRSLVGIGPRTDVIIMPCADWVVAD